MSLPSNFTLPPVPVNQSEPNYGGPPERPYFFYNNSIPNGMSDMVCMSDDRARGTACCQLSIGIHERAKDFTQGWTDGEMACRMRNTQANRDYWANCTGLPAAVKDLTSPYNLTLPLAEWPDASAERPCVPFAEYLASRNQTTHGELAWPNATTGVCAPIAFSGLWAHNATYGRDPPSGKTALGITDECCREIDGFAGNYRLGLGNNTDFSDWDDSNQGSAWSGFFCVLDKGKRGDWEKCVARFDTWSVCNSTASSLGRGRRGAGFVLLAAAAALAVTN